MEGTWKEVLRVGKGRLPYREIRPPWIGDCRHHLRVVAEAGTTSSRSFPPLVRDKYEIRPN